VLLNEYDDDDDDGTRPKFSALILHQKLRSKFCTPDTRKDFCIVCPTMKLQIFPVFAAKNLQPYY